MEKKTKFQNPFPAILRRKKGKKFPMATKLGGGGGKGRATKTSFFAASLIYSLLNTYLFKYDH